MYIDVNGASNMQ